MECLIDKVKSIADNYLLNHKHKFIDYELLDSIYSKNKEFNQMERQFVLIYASYLDESYSLVNRFNFAKDYLDRVMKYVFNYQNTGRFVNHDKIKTNIELFFSALEFRRYLSDFGFTPASFSSITGISENRVVKLLNAQARFKKYEMLSIEYFYLKRNKENKLFSDFYQIYMFERKFSA